MSNTIQITDIEAEVQRLLADQDVAKFNLEGVNGVCFVTETHYNGTTITRTLATSERGVVILTKVEKATNDKTLRNNLIKEMAASKFTQAQIASLLQVGQSTVSNNLKEK